MPREVISSFTEQEIRMVRGVRYRYVYEVTHTQVTTTRLVWRKSPVARKGVRFTRHGYPYTVVPHKGARFASYKDAFTMYEKPYTKMVTYDTFDRKYLYREKLPDVEDRMTMHVYTIRNKSKGEGTKVRHIEATIETYYATDDTSGRINTHKKLESSVANSDWAWIGINFDVEGEETNEVELDEKIINTYKLVIMDYDYHTVRHRESGDL